MLVSKWRTLSLFLYCITIIGLTGCQSNTDYIPVDSRPQPPGIKIDYHIVRPGETLYSIAWLYNMDFRKLAAANFITSPYIIRPKQRLSLKPSKKQLAKASPSASTPPYQAPTKVKPKAINITKKGSDSNKLNDNVLNKYNTKGGVRWRWPTKGPILRKFSLQGDVNKGIDLGGNLGEAVHSAGDGTVVYAGSGLLGYGNLIIIKHNQEFLSAYAHNSNLLIEEGSNVKVGQVIAEIGSSGTDRNKLHFEVRREGKPVNPLYYLPRR